MNSLIIVVGALVALSLAYTWGVASSRHIEKKTGVKMHSRPGYYGLYLTMWCAIPSAIVLLAYTTLQPVLRDATVRNYFPQEVMDNPAQYGAALRQAEAIASGYGVVGTPEPYVEAAGQALGAFGATMWMAALGLAAIAAFAGAFFARSRVSPQFRARNRVEAAFEFLLVVCSGIAILTTVGIVLSVLSEAIRFFTFVSPMEFFFGTRWNPTFSSTGTGDHGDFGLLPLLWGTLMITIIAMLVAVPLGLLSAVYLSEYASRRFRLVAKPLLEILAGIPTIVYGFFALITVGPFLADLGDAVGLSINATSALTAGLVMGIMIIPFVSSLSDDIISQVPQALRDGSYGLGATQSETIRRVVLPAALPGIVGAFLLAVSRAIGETMIVVLAAGNSPVLTANPFEAVSTITVTIVNQLTGDTDFASPQSLVAFALGLTLFVITLCLNVFAIWIVKKYREQYE